MKTTFNLLTCALALFALTACEEKPVEQGFGEDPTQGLQQNDQSADKLSAPTDDDRAKPAPMGDSSDDDPSKAEALPDSSARDPLPLKEDAGDSTDDEKIAADTQPSINLEAIPAAWRNVASAFPTSELVAGPEAGTWQSQVFTPASEGATALHASYESGSMKLVSKVDKDTNVKTVIEAEFKQSAELYALDPAAATVAGERDLLLAAGFEAEADRNWSARRVKDKSAPGGVIETGALTIKCFRRGRESAYIAESSGYLLFAKELEAETIAGSTAQGTAFGARLIVLLHNRLSTSK